MRPLRPLLGPLATGTALLLALAACSDDGSGSDGAGGAGGAGGERSGATSAAEETPEGPAVRTDDSDDHADQVYVAMGDSYTAAPGVDPAQGDSGVCGRSQVNYPSLVAGAFGGSTLVDVSCSGATTADLLGSQQLAGQTFPPQVDAVTADTDVVTLSTGGNDFGAFGVLAGQCEQPGATCPTLDLATAQAGLARVTTDLVAVIGAVRERAPQARVLVVGYPQVVPPGAEGCADLPVDGELLGLARLLNEELVNAQQRAAEQAGADYVDVFAATEGHALCSDDPWINGSDFVEAAPYHPLPAGQRAAAAEVISALDG
ncbi:SGNH/GDSL hydrolase family protein [Nocardioides sp. ChNu-153]|uniref:SGNH/GDSL hydrolase family protein n=1 Tax=unclassified Nocardioides TaxID=2615069 RepID=UPI002405466A|nr:MULTISPECIES: SGNH/GDSL hydrolase family protein [unclassified Nocardioides]MDF9715200.1 SGNH/GDSL hydrolase family protein [Nocardioides sp. ChNu-99]MDN7121021.1 SGNH/GDSL hydrolase family protein [Nocardioides sp. ChNu-153]